MLLIARLFVSKSLHKNASKTATRGIAAATPPCLAKKRKRKSRVDAETVLDSSQHRQRRLEELRRQLEEPMKVEPPKVANRILKCPYIEVEKLMSQEDFDEEVIALDAQLNEWVDTTLDSVDKEWLTTEINLIQSGDLSNQELVDSIRASLDKIEDAADHNKVNNFLGWYKKTTVKNFNTRFESTLKDVSMKTQDILLSAGVIPMEDMKAKWERIDEVKLSALDPWYRQEFYRKKRDLWSRRHTRYSQSRGPSMLPTISDPGTSFVQPFHPTPDVNLLEQEVKVGNVVMFMAILTNGDVKYYCKRVQGLPGDMVQTITGETVIVPEECFWALGDNPAESYDSRHYGAVPEPNLRKKYIFTYSWWPPRFKWLL